MSQRGFSKPGLQGSLRVHRRMAGRDVPRQPRSRCLVVCGNSRTNRTVDHRLQGLAVHAPAPSVPPLRLRTAPLLDIYGKSSGLRCLTGTPVPGASLELRQASSPRLDIEGNSELMHHENMFAGFTCGMCGFSVRRDTSRNAHADSNPINRTLARPPRLVHRGSEFLYACLRPTDADLHSTRHRRRFCISWPTLSRPPVQSLADPQRVRVVSTPFIR